MHAVPAVAAAALVSAGASAQLYFVDTIVDFSDASVFGSGIVTGPPDAGGYYFPDTASSQAFITLAFLDLPAFTDGEGADLRIFDLETNASDPLEAAQVFVSADGVDFFFAGSVIGGSSEGFIDLADQGLTGAYRYIRIVHVDLGTGDGLDVDAVAYFHPVPAPGLPAALLTAALAARARRRR